MPFNIFLGSSSVLPIANEQQADLPLNSVVATTVVGAAIPTTMSGSLPPISSMC